MRGYANPKNKRDPVWLLEAYYYYQKALEHFGKDMFNAVEHRIMIKVSKIIVEILYRRTGYSY